MKNLGFLTLVTVLLFSSPCMGMHHLDEQDASTKEAETIVQMDIVFTEQGKRVTGSIQVKLHEEKAPKTVANFLSYVDEGFYDGTIFHRVIPGFMIQGGGFTADMTQKKTKATIQNEAHNRLVNKRGSVAMARTQVINSASSQFFINVVDNDFLNYRDSSTRGYGYAVFAEVLEGMDLVDRIQSLQTTVSPPYRDVPKEAVIIQRAFRLTHSSEDERSELINSVIDE